MEYFMEQLSFFKDLLLYKAPIKYADLGNLVDSFLKKNKSEFRVKIIISEEYIIGKVQEITFPRNMLRLEKKYEMQNYATFHLIGHLGKKTKISVDEDFAILRHPDFPSVWLLFSDAGRFFMEKPLKMIYKCIRPRVTIPIINTNQFEKLCIYFQKQDHTSEIRIKQIGRRGKIKSKGATKNIESDRTWTDLSIAEGFQEAKEVDHWVSDVLVEYTNIMTKRSGIIKFDRNGEFLFRGEASLSFYTFIDAAAKSSAERYVFLKNRDKTPENNYLSRPFSIEFNFNILENKEQIYKLSKVIKIIPRSRMTILHGNPYFHAVFVDYNDGSVVELLILESNRINILPQGKATVSSLQRLCSSIFFNFREGELVNEN
jgi:hypothetical protein